MGTTLRAPALRKGGCRALLIVIVIVGYPTPVPSGSEPSACGPRPLGSAAPLARSPPGAVPGGPPLRDLTGDPWASAGRARSACGRRGPMRLLSPLGGPTRGPPADTHTRYFSEDPDLIFCHAPGCLWFMFQIFSTSPVGYGFRSATAVCVSFELCPPSGWGPGLYTRNSFTLRRPLRFRGLTSGGGGPPAIVIPCF